MNFRGYVGGIGCGAAVGWVAARWHLSGLAPVGLVSLAVGVALGYVISKLAWASGVNCLGRLLFATVTFALVVLFVEHAWLYHDFRRQWQEARANDSHIALFRSAEPWTPAEYFRHEMAFGRASLWCLDAALILAGAVGTVLLGHRLSANKIKTNKVVMADDAKEPPTPES